MFVCYFGNTSSQFVSTGQLISVRGSNITMHHSIWTCMRIGQVLDLTRTFLVTHQSLVFCGTSELAVNDGGGRKLIREGTENMYIVLLDFVLNCGWMGDGGVAQVLNSPNYVVVQFNIYMAYLTIQSILFVH